MHKLLTIPKIDNASSQNIGGLIKKASRYMETLKEMQNESNFDALITIMLIDKLDVETMRAWERHRKALAASWADAGDGGTQERNIAMHLPSFQDLQSFLQSEVEIFARSECA